MGEDEQRDVPRIHYEEDEAESDKATVLFEAGSPKRLARQRACLVVVGGNRSLGKIVPIRDGMTLGRALSCDLVLEEEGVSRKHASISVDVAAGTIQICDLGSSNGVLLGGVKIGSTSPMRDGDRYQVGDAAVALLHIDDLDETLAGNLIGSATLDVETKLPVRRRFLEALRREHRFATRYKTPLSVALFAVDTYKGLCDALGSEAGAFVLRRLAAMISGLLAREDVLVARYAEDQLIVMLPETSLVDARVAAEWIRKGAESAKLELEGKKTPSITLSGGIACTADDGETPTPEMLIERAEQGVYRAKLAGHNQLG